METFKLFGIIEIVIDKAVEALNKITKKASDAGEKIDKAADKIEESVDDAFQPEKPQKFGNALEQLRSKIDNQKSTLSDLKDKYKDLYLTHGKNSEEAQACAKEIEELSKELKENKERLQEAEESADEFDQSLDDVAESSEKTGGRLSGALKKIGAAVIAAFSIGAIVSFSTSLVNLAADAESAFAKVSTLLDTSSTNMEAYYDDIRAASSATGVAFTDFSEAVYQAISASVDQAEAVDFTTDAVKLAKAGFTQTATAVDILTTAMNAYGPAAGTAEEISNKLINTQNLGKTTVDELATNMGRVIPTANMYSVNIDTICTSYAEMTKNGIATAEATTYLNSMINELGASGTTASNVIQSELGMSFKQAMESGYSLTDILGILQAEAEKTGVSMGDMFGSQEAAKAAATLQQNADDFNSIMQSMADSAGMTEEAYDKVTNTFAAKSEKLKTQFQNMGISLGNAVLPALTKVTDYIEEKMPQIESMIGQFSPLLESMFDGILPLVTQLGESLFPVILDFLNALIPELINVGSAVLPIIIQALNILLPAVIQIISTVLPSVLSLLSPLLDLLSPILSLLEPILDILIALLEPSIQMLQPLIELLVYLLEGLLPPLTELLTFIADLITTYVSPAIEEGMASNMDSMMAFFDQFKILIDGIVLFISGTLDVIMGIVNVFIALFNGNFAAAGDALMQILNGLGNMVLGLLEAAFFNIIAQITSGLEQAEQFFTNFGTNISSFFSNLWNNSIEDAKAKLTYLKDTISNILENAAGLVSGIVERMKGFFNFEFQVPRLKMPHFNINPAGWNLSKLLEGQIPQLGIEWYAKAMDNGIIMDKPTIFGVNGNKLMAGGEAGSETVVGTMSLMEMIQGAVASQNQQLIAILEQILTAIVTHDETLLDKMLTALESMRFEVRDREFARLVREVKI